MSSRAVMATQQRHSAVRRRAVDRIAIGALAFIAATALGLMLFVLGTIAVRGFRALSWSFFTQGPVPFGDPHGGMAHAITGSLVLLALACALGVPIGLGAGVYLAEFGTRSPLRPALRFTADVLSGVPSIVTGMVVYALIVRQQGHFSAFAGGVGLALMVVPIVARTTEDMLCTVPVGLREAAWGLGLARWRTVCSITVRAALPGVLTGCVLALARACGETAPLLFTAFGNPRVSAQINQPIAALPLQIYQYALSPYTAWHQLAWAGALVLLAVVAAALALLRWVSQQTLAGAWRR